MGKTYKVTYKTQLNDRLKKVDFHGQQTYPLYVQVTYNRKTIFFKSYYFELFSNPKYVKTVKGKKTQVPTLKDIIEKENELIDFIINKFQEDFSLTGFKNEYDYYGTDLCTTLEEGFVAYMFIFLLDKGLPVLARALAKGSNPVILNDLLQDMKNAFQPSLYKELTENSIKMQQLYLPVYGFIQQTKTWPMLSLSVMEWETGDTKADFSAYLQKCYPDKNANEIIAKIQQWLTYIRKYVK